MGYSKFSAMFKKTRFIEGRTQDQLKRNKQECDGVTRDPVVVPQPSSKGSKGTSGNTSNERLTRRSYSMSSKITRQPSFGKSGLPIPKARNANANEKDTVSPTENGLIEESKVSPLLRPRNRNSSPVMSPKDITSKSESVHDRLATRSNSASRRSCSACSMDYNKSNGNASIDSDIKKSIKSPTSGNMSRLAGQKSNSPSPSHEKKLVNGHADASVRPKVKKSPTVSPYLTKPSLPPKPRRKTMDNSPTISREDKSRQKDNIKSETNIRTYNGELQKSSSAGRGNGISPVSNRRHTLGGKPALSAKPLLNPTERKLERPSSLYQRRGTESNDTNIERKRVIPERSRHRLTSLSSKSPSRIDCISSPSKIASVRPKSSFSPGSNLRGSGRFTDTSQDRIQSAPSSHVRFRSAGRTGVDKRDPSHSPKLRRKDVKRSQSLGPGDRKGKRSSIPGFVARCRQAWEDNVLKPLSKEKGAEDVQQKVVSPDNLRRMGPGQRSLVEMRKAMLFHSDTEGESRSRTGLKRKEVKSTTVNGETKSKGQAKKKKVPTATLR